MAQRCAMEIAPRIARVTLAAVAVLAALGVANANTLYKSVDRDGRVTFSDVPIDGAVAVTRIESSDSAKPAESRNAPVYLALADGLDEAVSQANAKVDLAEHALALERRSLVEDSPLSLEGARLSRADSQRIEFFKQDVASARRNLLRVLKQRNFLVTQSPLA